MKKKKEKPAFYDCIIRSEPPILCTKEWTDEWYRKRGTICKVTHMPATNPQPERTGQV